MSQNSQLAAIGAVATGAATLMLAPEAQATVYNIGVLPSDGSTISQASTLASLGSDRFNFTLPFNVGAGGPSYVHIETAPNAFKTSPDTVMSLFDSSDNFIADNNDGSASACGSAFCSLIYAGMDPNAGAGTNAGTLLAGDYYIVVAGFNGSSGEYIANFTAREIPEPGSLALLATGLAGVAALRRRRRN